MQEILKNDKKREKLLIFINPPYAEASNRKTPSGTGENKTQVSTDTKIYHQYSNIYGTATRELFAQFFIRIYNEIPHCMLASFSTLKYINAQYYDKFRKNFQAKFLRGFACPSDTFDNVSGQFPIGFLIWDTKIKKPIKRLSLDIFNDKNEYLFKKRFFAHNTNSYIIDWLRQFYDKKGNKLTFLRMQGTDFSNNRGVFFANKLSDNDYKKHLFTILTQNNLIPFAIYFAVRHAIPASWLNDRDQFLYPNDLWQQDSNFQNDCLAFMLFHSQNKIRSQEGDNHFIPFSESEVGITKEPFSSHFMYEFINGQMKQDTNYNDNALLDTQGSKDNSKEVNKGQLRIKNESFYTIRIPTKPLSFSNEARAVFSAGRELWRYYHSQDFNDPAKPYSVNASLYDIKAYFQGYNDKGRMNPPQKAQDEHYKKLIGELNAALSELAKEIEPKIYEYGFLLQ
ncbi:hypothetical protein CQA63_04475 [Helicobacter marmotae]|uniref:Uncharacterized protein n=1 Tax=Helicobacter marmotae TaxID=152490 RepID=A0A3D8I4D0_9HELI|nr:hypothetical protein CQA63_04475 [Helicobacter marmotae]